MSMVYGARVPVSYRVAVRVLLQTTDSSRNIWRIRWAHELKRKFQKLDLGQKAPEGFIAGIAQESCFYSSTALNELRLSLNCPILESWKWVCKPQWKSLLAEKDLQELGGKELGGKDLQEPWLKRFESKYLKVLTHQDETQKRRVFRPKKMEYCGEGGWTSKSDKWPAGPRRPQACAQRQRCSN